MAVTQVAIQRKNYPKSIRTYTFATVLVLLAAAVWGYFQYVKLAAAQDALAKEQQLTASMQANVDQFKTSYTDLKGSFDKDFASTISSVQAVLPPEENYTELTRLLDKFFQDNNINPIFVSDLKFSKPKVDATKEISILPFTMTISTTRDNFEKFLRFIGNSGSLEDKTRLMEIRSISINFQAPAATAFASAGTTIAAAEIPLLNVSVSLNAYFQKPTPGQKKTTTTAPSISTTPIVTASPATGAVAPVAPAPVVTTTTTTTPAP
jgi:hypothetical protein